MQRIKPHESELKNARPINKIGDVQKPGTSHTPHLSHLEADKENKSLCCCCYDNSNKTGFKWKRYLITALYVLLYLLVLGSYFFLILNASLWLIGHYTETLLVNKTDLFECSRKGIGLTVIPSINDEALIWYTINNETQYKKYVNKIEDFLNKRKNISSFRNRNNDDLGPCGVKPYGYGSEPCVYIKINKQRGWTAKPLSFNSSEIEIPEEVRRWVKFKTQKLLLYCEGSEPWLKEHLGHIRYYPYPPGFDPRKNSLNMTQSSPIVAVQFSKFSLGVYLTVRCTLWSDMTTSKVEFVLYVNKSQSP